ARGAEEPEAQRVEREAHVAAGGDFARCADELAPADHVGSARRDADAPAGRQDVTGDGGPPARLAGYAAQLVGVDDGARRDRVPLERGVELLVGDHADALPARDGLDQHRRRTLDEPALRGLLRDVAEREDEELLRAFRRSWRLRARD